MSDKEERILAILKDIQPDAEFENGKDFIDEAYLDSFDVITLVSALEEEFGVLISALDILPENFGSVKAIEDLVLKSPERK